MPTARLGRPPADCFAESSDLSPSVTAIARRRPESVARLVCYPTPGRDQPRAHESKILTSLNQAVAYSGLPDYASRKGSTRRMTSGLAPLIHIVLLLHSFLTSGIVLRF